MDTLREHQSKAGKGNAGRPKSPAHRAAIGAGQARRWARIRREEDALRVAHFASGSAQTSAITKGGAK